MHKCTGRMQQVSYDGQLSPIRPVQFGVPELGSWFPAVRILYTADVIQVVVKHGLQRHQYADDCQVCVTTSVDDVALAVDRLARCVSDVGDWMSLSQFCLNSSKIQAIWLGHKNQNDRINIRNVQCYRRLSVSSTAYKVSLCENCQQQSCRAFIGLTIHSKIICGGRPLLREILA